MVRAALLLAVTALIVVALGAPALAGGDKPAPYVLITKDGYRVDAMEKPVKEGGQVKVRLAHTGQLTLLPEASIDWAATERYNAPRPAPARKREAISTAEGARSMAGSAGTHLKEPVEMTIIGGKSQVRSGSGESAESGEAAAGGEPPASVSPAIPTDPAAVASQLAELRRQMAAAKSAYDGAVKTRESLQARLADLQDKRGRDAESSSVQNYTTPSQRAIAQVQSQLTAVNEQISTMESRMNDIRGRAVELGGSVD